MTTADELAAQGRDWILAVEAGIEAMDDGVAKTRLTRHASLVHRQMELMHTIASENGVAQPFDGGPKPPPQP